MDFVNFLLKYLNLMYSNPYILLVIQLNNNVSALKGQASVGPVDRSNEKTKA